MKIYVVFDDSNLKSEIIRDVIGDKGFADVTVKKRKLENYYQEAVQRVFPELEWKVIHSVFEFHELIKEMEKREDIRILHCFSHFLISDISKALLSYEKLRYVDEPYRGMSEKKTAILMFPDSAAYITFCNLICNDGKSSEEAAKHIKESFEIEGLVDIGIIGNFIQCITGNFDSRYFNSLQGNEYTLVKSSTNKKKIKSEYTYYHLLPDDMKYWYVMPFDYKESENTASYTMERLHMTDLAIKWVHGSISISEFEEIMNKYFYFFKNRHRKACTKEEYEKVATALYTDKVVDRIEELKKCPEYKLLSKYLQDECAIDELVKQYFELKSLVENKVKYDMIRVIGHGDPCFANTLYNKSTKTLKFIDPKGALSEEELWTNEYYDLAKLSHSVCGRYDFFNNAMYDIKINEDFSLDLNIPFDNSKYKETFRKKLEENGFDYLTVRIYEASLFLSMLPLHIDNPHKVLGFVLNVKNILEEIRECIKNTHS